MFITKAEVEAVEAQERLEAVASWREEIQRKLKESRGFPLSIKAPKDLCILYDEVRALLADLKEAGWDTKWCVIPMNPPVLEIK